MSVLRLGKVLFCTLFLVSRVAPAFGETSSYEELKRSTKAATISSANLLRTHLNDLDGKVVELQGEVSGIMTRAGTTIVLLRLPDDTAILNAPAAVNTPTLRAGATLRLLTKVNAAARDCPLEILAALEVQPAEPVTGPIDGAAIVPMSEESDVLPAPPSTPFVITSPGPKPKQQPLTARGGSSIARTPTRRTVKPAQVKDTNTFDPEEAVQSQKDAYEGLVRRHNSRLKPQVIEEIAEALLRAGYKYNMDPRFLAAIIAVESDFDVHCVSRSGAMGLGQLMPFNLKEAGVNNPWNPTENVFGTARLLRGHLDDYKNRSNGTLLAVAAYNAGPGAVRRAGYKVPNGSQVQRYVWKVYYRYKAFAPDMFK